jgi:predicted transcriptional regulator
MTNRDELLVLAAQIVSAHVANNTVVPGDVPKLINEVYRALIDAGHPSNVAATAEPAVPVKRSVTPDHLICLECGKHFSMLKRHLGTDHQLTPDQYRQKWDLAPSYPIVAPNYAKTRSVLAKKIGLGRTAMAKLVAGKKRGA